MPPALVAKHNNVTKRRFKVDYNGAEMTSPMMVGKTVSFIHDFNVHGFSSDAILSTQQCAAVPPQHFTLNSSNMQATPARAAPPYAAVCFASVTGAERRKENVPPV